MNLLTIYHYAGFQDCRYDNVTLYRNLGRGRQSRILPTSMIFSSTHCGQDSPPAGWTPNSLSIVFQTDNWIERRGFRMNYEFESKYSSIYRTLL